MDDLLGEEILDDEVSRLSNGRYVQYIRSTKNKGTLVVHRVQVNIGSDLLMTSHMHNSCGHAGDDTWRSR